jgi:hypothetical protein
MARAVTGRKWALKIMRNWQKGRGGLHLQIQLELLSLVRVVVPLREYLVGETYDAP